MGTDALTELKYLVDKYKTLWLGTQEDVLDDLMADLLNELEDIYNPSRLSGN